MTRTTTRQPIQIVRTPLFAIAICLCSAAASCSRNPEPGTPIAALRVLGGLGDTPGRYGYPRCLESDPTTSTLWVIDRTARVQRIDPLTGLNRGWFHTPEHALGKPTGFAVAPGPDERGNWTDSLLYIADTHYHRILIYNPPAPITDDRKREINPPPLIAQFGSFGREPGQFIYPTDVAVLLSADRKHVDRLYVSEYGGNDRVSAFDGSPEHRFLFSFGAFGPAGDNSKIEFNRPQSLAIDTRASPSRLLVTDACNHRLGLFTLDGSLIRWIGGADSIAPGEVPPEPDTINIPAAPDAGPTRLAEVGKPARFLYPYGLHMLPDGTALVSEFGAARVQQIDLDTGTCLGSWGKPGRHEGELAAPWGITTIDTTAYVLDSGNNRILAFPAPTLRH